MRFLSVQTPFPHLFTLMLLKSNSALSIHLDLGLPFSLLPPGLPCSNFFTGLYHLFLRHAEAIPIYMTSLICAAICYRHMVLIVELKLD